MIVIAVLALVAFGAWTVDGLKQEIRALQSADEAAESQVADLRADVRSFSGQVDDLDGRMSEAEEQAGGLQTSVVGLQSGVYRLANSVSLLSLLTNYGGYQPTSSAAGQACIASFTAGLGSITDCGWQHVD